MADLNRPGVRIQIIVERDTPHGKFRDAIYMSPDEFSEKKDSEIDALADERVDNHVAVIEAAKHAPKYEPTKAELQEEALRLATQLSEISEKINAKG